MLLASFVALAAFAGTTRAAVVATSPGPGMTFNAGGPCPLLYNLDTTGTWKNMTIELMSGSNTEMTSVARVASGVDGTTGLGSYSWTCPEVVPYSAIYFYQLTNDAGLESVWTTRFAIASATGVTIPPPNSLQPSGDAIPWGIGALAATTTTSTTSPSTTLTTSTSTSTSSGASSSAIVGSCGWNNLCPASSPCCSEWGICGTGRHCLAGCNPLGSSQPGACMPIPVCKTAEYTFRPQDLARILSNGSTWNGDAKTYDWIIDAVGAPQAPLAAENEFVLSLTQEHGGTRISSTRSMLYGTVTARVKTVGVQGVVTAFILMSGVKDEVDWEFTSNNTNTAQTNFFWEGDVAGYTTGSTVEATSRAESFHDYGISWTPEALTWLVDGKVVRTVTKASTQDLTMPGLYHYPRTPSRIQLSVWPAGIAGGAQGTIDWSGGMIDWSSPEYLKNGQYAAYVESVSVSCYDEFDLCFIASSGSSNPAPTATSLALSSSVTLASWGSATTTSTNIPLAVSRKRKLVSLRKRAADPSLTSYIYGGNDTTGQVTFWGSDALTILQSSTSTGLAANTGTQSTTPPLSGVGSATGHLASTIDHLTGTESSVPTPTESPKTAQQGWDALSTAARAGIYVGGACASLLIVVVVGYLWNKASTGSAQPSTAYAPIGDQGEMLPSEQMYQGPSGLHEGGALYQGGQYQGGVAPSSQLASSGYVPSANLRAQYGLNYQPLDGKVVGS